MAIILLVIYFGGMLALWPSYAVITHHHWCKAFPNSSRSVKLENIMFGFLFALLWPVGWAIPVFCT
jgi:hypothetical protein